jgi:hypothetical protein
VTTEGCHRCVRSRGRRGRETLLTPDVHQGIVSSIRAGAYDYVAAEAYGISQATFHEWIRRGEGRDRGRPRDPRYAAFAADVRQAHAQARLSAEIRVAKDTPQFWLRIGPGREAPGRPGWTEGTEATTIKIEVVMQLIDEVKGVLKIELADDPDRLQRIADRLRRLAPALRPGETDNGGYAP